MRLTKRDEYGNADIIGVDSGDLQLNLGFDELNIVTAALNKLAAYEDAEAEGRLVVLWEAIGGEVGMNNLLRCPFCNGDLVLSWHGGEDAYLCDCCGVRISLPQASITHLTDIVNRRAQQENRPLTCDGCQGQPYDKNGRYLLGKDNPCYGCRRNSNTKDAYRSKPEEEI